MMSEADWELFNKQFDALFQKLYVQARKAEDLEARVKTLEGQLRDDGLPPEMTRTTLHLVETCALCSRSLDGEQIVHALCAQLENARAEVTA